LYEWKSWKRFMPKGMRGQWSIPSSVQQT
jgi:hypothetical protein